MKRRAMLDVRHICPNTGSSDRVPGPNNLAVNKTRISKYLTTETLSCH
jgi:hypothetical protein